MPLDILLNFTVVAVMNASLNDKWRAFKCNSIGKCPWERALALHSRQLCKASASAFGSCRLMVSLVTSCVFHPYQSHFRKTEMAMCSSLSHHTSSQEWRSACTQVVPLAWMSRSSEHQLKASNWDNLLTLGSLNLVIFLNIETNCLKCLCYDQMFKVRSACSIENQVWNLFKQVWKSGFANRVP